MKMVRHWKTKFQKGIASMLAAALLLGASPIVLPPAKADEVDELGGEVQTESWVQEYLDKLVDWGVMRGDQEGNMDPEREITRAEYVSMINRAYGYDERSATPFQDVEPDAWYYDDIGIAYQAGYFKGSSEKTASPESTLTREEATVILGRNLMLQEGLGETLDFTDSRELSDWSRGLVKTAAERGIVKGYPDGTFKPKNEITRGEVASLLVNAIGTPISTGGEYNLGGVYGNLTIAATGVTLRNTTVAGDLYISGGVGLGYVTLENVKVLGKIIASGAGESNKGDSSIILRNVEADQMVVDSPANQFVTIRAEGDTDVAMTSVRTPSYLEDVSPSGQGLKYIELNGEEGTGLELAGNIQEVVNLTPRGTLVIARGSAEKISVDEKAVGSHLNIQNGASAKEINLDVAATVSGTGDISHLNVNAGGSTVTILPDTVTVRPGVIANISGSAMDSVAATESSQDPKLLAGYPSAQNIAPTTADAVFSTNKAGTIYWAVSSITDGSVEAEDLISPPVYGGKVLQSGTIQVASSKTELVARLSKLTSDGSYYISAIMIDNRGKRSPVKVNSFSTPDDTVPNFTTGYPTISKLTKDTAFVTVMSNKSCQLYYALLPKGGAAPTEADFKANAVTGNLGYGTVDMIKNTTNTFRVNRGLLDELVSYDLYLWLTDYDGAKSSAIKKVSFTTIDGTPPEIISGPNMTAQKEKNVTYSVTLNEAGTFYWVVVKSGDEYPKPQAGQSGTINLDSDTAKLQVSSGINALKSGKSNMTANKDTSVNISGLEAETAYDLYYIAEDKAGNFMPSVQMLTFNTLDVNAPKASIEFTEYNGNESSSPLANTDIRIVFNEKVQSYPEGLILNELYEAVTSAKTEAERVEARLKLSEVLQQVITFYDLTDGSEDLAVVRNVDGTDEKWDIDYRYAQVLVEDGHTVILFPYEESGAISSLNLKSGSTYRFEVRGLSDASRNVMGTVYLPDKRGFTTVFAQVNLKNVSSPTISNDTGDPDQITPVTGALREITTHFAFTLQPISTSKVDDAIHWDMLLWSDTSIEFSLYRREYQDAATAAEDWEYLYNSKIIVTADGEKPIGLSMTSEFLQPNQNQHRFELLNDLKDDRIYEYAIRLTSVDGNEQEDTWSSTINMKVGIAAGDNSYLDNLASRVTPSMWKEAVTNTRDLNSIGNNVAKGTDELEMKKTFSDRVSPKFINGYPIFEPVDSAVTMSVQLDRQGTVYYVVAPVNNVSTLDANGRAVDWRSLPGDGSGKKYADGSDYTGTAEGGVQPPVLIAPTDLDITGDKLSGTNASIKWGSINGGPSTTVEIVTDLIPETEYMVYFVIKGTASIYSKVLCYGFKTTEVNRPVLTVTLDNPSAMVKSDRDANINYMLMVVGKETAIFNEKLGDNHFISSATQDEINTYGKYTLLEAMQLDVKDGNDVIGSVFDFYADQSTKDIMSSLISSQTENGSSVTLVGSETLVADKWLTVPCQNNMVGTAKYWFIVVGSSTLGSGDAFRANRSLFVPDSQPPQVISVAVYPGETELKEEYKDAVNQAYSGTVTVTFSEELWYKSGDSSWKTLVDKGVPVANGYASTDVIWSAGVPGITLEHKVKGDDYQPCYTLQFNFTNVRLINSTITFDRNLCDSQGNTGSSPLTLTMALVEENGLWTPTFKVSPAEWDATGR